MRSKKIVLCNFTFTNKEEFFIKDNDDNFNIEYANDFTEALNKNGFMLIVKRKDLPNMSKYSYLYVRRGFKIADKEIVDFDINYRRKLNYEYIVIIDNQYSSNKDFNYDKFNHILFTRDLLVEDTYDYQKLLSLYNKKKDTITIKRRNNLYELYEIIKDRETFTAKELSILLGVSKRTIERDLISMNLIFNVIGYNLLKRNYYVVK